jgi:hypothetical protein
MVPVKAMACRAAQAAGAETNQHALRGPRSALIPPSIKPRGDEWKRMPRGPRRSGPSSTKGTILFLPQRNKGHYTNECPIAIQKKQEMEKQTLEAPKSVNHTSGEMELGLRCRHLTSTDNTQLSTIILSILIGYSG